MSDQKPYTTKSLAMDLTLLGYKLQTPADLNKSYGKENYIVDSEGYTVLIFIRRRKGYYEIKAASNRWLHDAKTLLELKDFFLQNVETFKTIRRRSPVWKVLKV